jgi:O-antigen/teichoic acid export membrane protein
VPILASRPNALAAAAVPAAAVLANLASYALLLAAAHAMTPSDYGKVSSLLGLLLISTIPMFALQTVTARRVASGDGLLGVVRGASLVAATSTAGLAALSPALALFLHLPSPFGVLLVAATIPATAVLGTAMGAAQGRRAFRRLAWLVLASTGGRSLGGLAGLLLHPTPSATLSGVLVGTGLAAIAVAGRGGGLARHGVAVRDRSSRGVVPETLHAAHAHGAFLLLTSLDVLLARHVLPGPAAGVYAVGSVITRAAVWLPQSAVLLMFASLAQREHHHSSARRAALVVAGLGGGIVAVSALFGRLLVTIVGGPRYHELDGDAWLFALLGASLALLQLSVMAGLAQRRTRRATLLWVTIAADGGIVLATSAHATPTRLVVTLVAVTAAAATVSVFVTVRQAVPPDGHGGGVNAGSSPLPNSPATPTGTG